MKVLVIGAGNMGSGFVKQLSAAGHQAGVTARNAAKAQAVAQQYGDGLGTSIAPTWIGKN